MTGTAKRHVVLTGEVGAGKSTALRAALALLGVQAQGVETYCPQARVRPIPLYLRAFGSGETGELLAILPDGDTSRVAPLFDTLGVSLLRAAREGGAEVIAVDECGRLERAAPGYRQALRECLDGEKPMLIALRKRKAEWADFIRSHPAVTLLEVTPENRSGIPQAVCEALRRTKGE